MIEAALAELAKAGGTELFLSSGEHLLEKVKKAKDIKQLFINTGEFFLDHENNADQLFDDMANVLSKQNMIKLTSELKDEPGYKLKDKLLNSLMGIMKEYEIPHPKTADVFFKMSQRYVYDSDIERRRAENGYF